MKHWGSIVAACVGAAVLYGVIHDQITARICLEYFTIGHRRAFESDSPTLHALYWGVIATWWAGLFSGLIVATAARLGRWPKLTIRQVWPLVVALLVVMGAAAAGLGLVVHSFAENYPPDEPIRRGGLEVPMSEYADYVTCAFAHAVSYQVGFGGSIVVALVAVIRRWRRARRERRE